MQHIYLARELFFGKYFHQRHNFGARAAPHLTTIQACTHYEDDSLMNKHHRNTSGFRLFQDGNRETKTRTNICYGSGLNTTAKSSSLMVREERPRRSFMLIHLQNYDIVYTSHERRLNSKLTEKRLCVASASSRRHLNTK